MIHVGVPYCPRDRAGPKTKRGRDYGLALNIFYGNLPAGDWGLNMDHDLYFTTRDWYRRLEAAVEKKPDAGFFTLKRWPTSGGTPWLGAGMNVDEDNPFDMRMHWKIGGKVAEKYEGQLTDITDRGFGPDAGAGTPKGEWPNSGTFLMTRKTWEEAGGWPNGMSGIDQEMHKRVRALGKRCYLIEDVYCFHAKKLGTKPWAKKKK